MPWGGGLEYAKDIEPSSIKLEEYHRFVVDGEEAKPIIDTSYYNYARYRDNRDFKGGLTILTTLSLLGVSFISDSGDIRHLLLSDLSGLHSPHFMAMLALAESFGFDVSSFVEVQLRVP